MYDDQNVPMKAVKRDERVDLMERYVGLEREFAQAMSEREDASSRVGRLRNDMDELRRDIQRSVESTEPKNEPGKAAFQ